jgi:hypothetical protein
MVWNHPMRTVLFLKFPYFTTKALIGGDNIYVDMLSIHSSTTGIQDAGSFLIHRLSVIILLNLLEILTKKQNNLIIF